jgi:DNA invertase Pin-like site-specific DNA recombinase
LQPGDVIIAERIDRLSRLPLPEAEALIDTIRQKGAKLSIPGVVDLSQFSEHLDPIAKIVLDATQEMLLKISLQIARDDYEIRRKRQQEGISQAKQSYPSKYQGRRPDPQLHERVHSLRAAGHTWKETARLAGCSVSYAKALGREMKDKFEM